jgi:hypothetical protein
MDQRQMVKKIWAVLYNVVDPSKDYNIGHRWVKNLFFEDGLIESAASIKRFDKAWDLVREKMRKMAK